MEEKEYEPVDISGIDPNKLNFAKKLISETEKGLQNKKSESTSEIGQKNSSLEFRNNNDLEKRWEQVRKKYQDGSHTPTQNKNDNVINEEKIKQRFGDSPYYNIMLDTAKRQSKKKTSKSGNEHRKKPSNGEEEVVSEGDEEILYKQRKNFDDNSNYIAHEEENDVDGYLKDKKNRIQQMEDSLDEESMSISTNKLQKIINSSVKKALRESMTTHDTSGEKIKIIMGDRVFIYELTGVQKIKRKKKK